MSVCLCVFDSDSRQNLLRCLNIKYLFRIIRHFGTTNLSLRFDFDLYEDCVFCFFFFIFFFSNIICALLFVRPACVSLCIFFSSIIIVAWQINQWKMKYPTYNVRNPNLISIKKVAFIFYMLIVN